MLTNLFAPLRNPWPDRRAERTLGGVSLLVSAAVIAMIVFVGIRAWPVFAHNGLSWLFPGGSLETEISNMQATGVNPPASAFHLRAWPLVYGTLMTSAIAVALGLVIAVLSSIFIVELAPARLRRVVIPVIRLLASVPSVIYGLIGVLVLVPFVGNHLVTASEKASEASVVELTGAGLGVAAVILTVMITPIMIALICEALIVRADILARGSGRARPEPAARGAGGHAARHTPGDRRRGRPGDRPRAGRGRDDPDGLRRAIVRAESRRRSGVLL